MQFGTSFGGTQCTYWKNKNADWRFRTSARVAAAASGSGSPSDFPLQNNKFNATRDRGQKTEDCTVVNEGLVSR